MGVCLVGLLLINLHCFPTRLGVPQPYHHDGVTGGLNVYDMMSGCGLRLKMVGLSGRVGSWGRVFFLRKYNGVPFV